MIALEELEQTGVKFKLTDAGEMTVVAPEGVPAEVAAFIRENERVLHAQLRRRALTADPRPELEEDSALWVQLLCAAYDVDGEDPTGLFGVLHGLRCCGARLVVAKGQVRLRGGDYAEYEQDKQRWLVPCEQALRQLLAGLSTAGS